MIRGTDVLAVSLDDPGPRAWMITLLPALVLCVATIVIAWQLLRLLQRIQQHRAFERQGTRLAQDVEGLV